MGELGINFDLEEDLDCPCDIDNQCCDDGCLFRMFVGPCEAFTESDCEVDMSMMCSPKTATAHTPNFIRPLREKMYRDSCRKRRVRGTPDLNFDVEFDICQTDPAMQYLLADCPITVVMVPRADLFNIEQPLSSFEIAIIRGHFIGSDWSWNNEFEECQSTSRNFSATGKICSIKQWTDALPSTSNNTFDETALALRASA